MFEDEIYVKEKHFVAINKNLIELLRSEYERKAGEQVLLLPKKDKLVRDIVYGRF